MGRWIATVSLLTVLVAGPAAAGESGYPRSYSEQAAWGLVAVGANLFYMPAKLLYAGVGGVTGCLAFVLTAGSTDAARQVWSPALGGTWVLSPAMVRGEEPILFSGESYE